MSKETQQAVYGGRAKEPPSELMARFSESHSFDRRLAPWDVRCSKAHSAMLCEVGLISSKERDEIHKGLDAILKEIEAGRFKWDEALEDVHMNIERALAAKTPAGEKLQTARSRNDQIATDMRLYLKDAAAELAAKAKAAIAALLDLAEKNTRIIIPSYTHLQRAQPVTMAHHLMAYVEMLGRDVERFDAFIKKANVCPLGSGAVAGSTLSIDRAFAAKQLGFVDRRGRARLTGNSMDAVADRDLFIEFATACALCMTHLSRAAEDFILWSSAEFGFVDLPDAFTTGSSLMPQKKNPDAFELIRGKAARTQGALQTLLTLVKGLPLTYNRDLQEDKPPVFDAFDQTAISLDVFAACVAGATANAAACAKAASDPGLLATDLADWLVEREAPFREAHHIVGRLVALAEEKGVALNGLTDPEAKSVDARIEKGWRDVFDLKRALARREREGMPGPKQTEKSIKRWRKKLEK